jgi:hypothetical protein
MARNTRYLINAAVALALGAHSAYWFATGGAARAGDLELGFRVLEGVVGFAGALWFFVRAQRAAS